LRWEKLQIFFVSQLGMLATSLPTGRDLKNIWELAVSKKLQK
jgi:hypothetical protein